jgi:glycosyltransferase involved in cell wall biosynthesis
MNILFVHEVDWEKKVVFDFHSLSELLASFGHNVFIIDFNGFQKGKRIESIVTARTEICKFSGRSRNDVFVTVIRPALIKAPFLDRASALVTHYVSIENVIRRSRIDAIVLYSVPTNGYQVVKLAKKYNIPVVFRSIDTLYKLVPYKLFSAPTFSLETWVYKNSDRIMALSPKLSEYVVRLGKDNEEKVELLLFGVDLNKFHPSIKTTSLRQELGFTGDNLVILFVGTLFDFSGLDDYLEQFPEVIERLPNARLLIVGGGALLKKLKRSAQELRIEKYVIFTGFQPFELMPQYINVADICINPFRLTAATRDIIPGKILQYLACGKPVLATPLPGMISQIKGLENGLFYSLIGDFAANTVKLLTDKRLLNEVGEKGLQYVKNNHDEIGLARKLEQVLFDEVKQKRVKRSTPGCDIR